MSEDITFGIGNDLLGDFRKKFIKAINRLSLAAEEISKTHLSKFKKNKLAEYVLIGESCISIDTHWLLIKTTSGFRRIVILCLEKFGELTFEKDQDDLNDKLVDKKILVTDCQKSVLSPSTYNKKEIWNKEFDKGYCKWKCELKGKIESGATVIFAYKRIFDRFLTNENAKVWLQDNKISEIYYYNGRNHELTGPFFFINEKWVRP